MDININTSNSQTSVKQLRQEIKSLRDTLLNLEQGTAEYTKVAQECGEKLHNLREVTEQTQSFSSDFGDVLSNITKTTSGLVGGIGALQGAINLLGGDTKVAVEAIAKLQSIMAISQGLAQVDTAIKSFKKLLPLIRTATVAMRTLAMSTPFTAAIAGATALAGGIALVVNKLKEAKENSKIEITAEGIVANKRYAENAKDLDSLRSQLNPTGTAMSFENRAGNLTGNVLNTIYGVRGSIQAAYKKGDVKGYNEALINLRKNLEILKEELKNAPKGPQEDYYLEAYNKLYEATKELEENKRIDFTIRQAKALKNALEETAVVQQELKQSLTETTLTLGKEELKLGADLNEQRNKLEEENRNKAEKAREQALKNRTNKIQSYNKEVENLEKEHNNRVLDIETKEQQDRTKLVIEDKDTEENILKVQLNTTRQLKEEALQYSNYLEQYVTKNKDIAEAAESIVRAEKDISTISRENLSLTEQRYNQTRTLNLLQTNNKINALTAENKLDVDAMSQIGLEDFETNAKVKVTTSPIDKLNQDILATGFNLNNTYSIFRKFIDLYNNATDVESKNLLAQSVDEYYQKCIDSAIEYYTLEEELIQANKQARIEATNEILQATADTFSNIASLYDNSSSQYKALATTQTIITAIQSAFEVWAKIEASTGGLGTAVAVAKSVAILTSAIATINKINSATNSKSNISTGMNTVTNYTPTTNLVSSNLESQEYGYNRVYVTERDITTVQKRVKVRENITHF